MDRLSLEPRVAMVREFLTFFETIFKLWQKKYFLI